ncbi:MAG TPA: hypothetical protein VFJ98_09235 [Mycobacteriales bacterium]|nr:hypothetical protein [Mycobacteriales bacterium]
MDARPVAVIDLDGVLADVRHRLHHVEGPTRDWEAFFAGIPDDPVLPEGRAVADRLAADHDLVYLTGRPERTRAATETWLGRHRLPRGELIMRRERDHRPARVAKPSLLRGLAADRRVAIVVDDDPEVCAALRRRGWPVLVADWMTRPSALHVAQEDLGAT